jgi:hypothetical protein
LIAAKLVISQRTPATDPAKLEPQKYRSDWGCEYIRTDNKVSQHRNSRQPVGGLDIPCPTIESGRTSHIFRDVGELGDEFRILFPHNVTGLNPLRAFNPVAGVILSRYTDAELQAERMVRRANKFTSQADCCCRRNRWPG